MNKSCSFLSSELTNHPIFLLVDEGHPLFGKLGRFAGEAPLDHLHVALAVFARVPDLQRVALIGTFEGGVLERCELPIFGLRDCAAEGSVLEVVVIEEDAASSIVDEEAVVGEEGDVLTVLLHQRVVERNVANLFPLKLTP